MNEGVIMEIKNDKGEVIDILFSLTDEGRKLLDEMGYTE